VYNFPVFCVLREVSPQKRGIEVLSKQTTYLIDSRIQRTCYYILITLLKGFRDI
jgi:hypothetical protein